MDKQSTEIIENFINFLKEKKKVIQNYEDKYSKPANEEVLIKRYEWEDIISESNDIISQSIQAIRSLQMENENLRETISTFQALQNSSNLKQSVFTFEDKNKQCNEYNIEDHLYNDGNNQFDEEEFAKIKTNEMHGINSNNKDKPFNLIITKENDIRISQDNQNLYKNIGSKDLLEEEEILPYKPYHPLKNNVISSEKYNPNQQLCRENTFSNVYNKSNHNNEEVQNIVNNNQIDNSPSFSRSSRKMENNEQYLNEKENVGINENILIVDRYNVNKIEGENLRNMSNSHDYQIQINEDYKNQEDLFKNNENNSSSISFNKSPLKVGIRQKLKSFVNKESCNSSRIKTENQSMNYNVNSQSQTLNLSNYHNKPEKEYEIHSGKYRKSNITIEQEDRESLLNEILKKLKSKENFKNYFTLKYSDGSYIEFQNKLFNCESFLYEVGKELFEIENQINLFPLPEETKSSLIFNSDSVSSVRNTTSRVNINKREELSKTMISQGINTKDKYNMRACSNKNIKKTEIKNNENSYLEPINFEKTLRSNGNYIKNEINLVKKPFNRFANRGNSIDRRKSNRSGEYLNHSKSREFYDNHRQNE